MKTFRRMAVLAAALGLAQNGIHAAPETPAAEAPALTVILVVDQLTAERTREWAHKPSSSGFRRLWRNGLVYANAAFDHATTATAPGHATLSTGVHPAVHGVISNFWFQRNEQRSVASVRDARHSLLGDEGTGVSPTRLAAPALADLLHAQSQGRGKVFAVSIKDRGAVFLAGKQGKAFWYSSNTGTFVTSTYYYPDGRVPEWLAAYNAEAHEDLPNTWELLLPEEGYRYEDGRVWERPPEGWTREFPHRFAPQGTPRHFDQLRYAPQGDAITAGLAKAIIEEESLGEDEHPDLLSISLSATDRIGHAFGHNSREAEDNLHRLDRLLSEIIAELEERLGRERFLLVLSSDHGMRPIPESVPGADPQASRIFSSALTRELNSALRSRFGVEQDLVLRTAAPWVYLDLKEIAQAGLEAGQVADKAAEWFEALPQISRAIPVARLDSCKPAELCELIRNNVYSGRSGEIYLVPAENSFFSSEPPRYAASHGSPHLHDRSVPIIFYGLGLQPAVVARPVTPRHIAPALAAAAGLELLPHWEAPLAEVSAARTAASHEEETR